VESGPCCRAMAVFTGSNDPDTGGGQGQKESRIKIRAPGPLGPEPPGWKPKTLLPSGKAGEEASNFLLGAHIGLRARALNFSRPAVRPFQAF